MKQYNQNTTEGTFLVIDYGTANYGPFGTKRILVMYTDGAELCRRIGWFNYMYHAHQKVCETAHALGIKLVGKSYRVA